MNYKKHPGINLKNQCKLINNSKPTISIITPYYNGKDAIQETFNSVINQTYPFFEWIIIDDGSTDKKCTLYEGRYLYSAD